MAKSKTFLAVREEPVIEVLDEPTVSNLPTVAQSSTVSIGKIPGEIHDLSVVRQMTIRALFVEIGIKDIDRCEIQRNGQYTNLDEFVKDGDTILAIPRIRGN